MNLRYCAIVLSLVAVAGCDSTPTAPPPPTPVLAVSQSSVALSRTSTVQITATSTVAGTATDVTATSTWRSGNEEVATVSAGRIVAVGPGTANITVENAGQTQTVAVTVRRRTYLTGEVRVETVDGDNNISGVGLAIDGAGAGGRGTSGYVVALIARLINNLGQTAVEPGNHTVTVTIGTRPSVRPTYSLTWVVPLRLLDRDTGEVLATISLAAKTVKVTADEHKVDWTFVVPTFTS